MLILPLFLLFWLLLHYICRTLLLPIRYRTIEDAMGICEALGERGDFLKPFASYEEYAAFFTSYLKADLQAMLDGVQTLLL